MDNAQVSKKILKKSNEKHKAKIGSGQKKLESDYASERSDKGCNRRAFLGHVSKITAASIAVGSIGLPPLLRGCNEAAHGQEVTCEIGPQSGSVRADAAFQVRLEAAEDERNISIPDHPCNGDEDSYPNKIGNYSKGLHHNSRGEVDPNAYNALIVAISSGEFADFEALSTNGHLGCPNPTRQRRLVN